MPELEIVALPKSTSGRQARPLDDTFAKELVSAMRKRGSTPDAEGNRPFFVCKDRYESKGKASADGRRYATHVREQLGLEKVSVRTYPDGKRFGWGLYLPLPTDSEESD